MKKIFIRSLIIVGVLFTVFIYYYNTVYQRHSSIIIYGKHIPEDSIRLRNYEINARETGKRLRDCILPDGKNLSSYMNERIKPLLVLRTKESDCGMCVDNELSLIKDIFGEDKDQFIILTTSGLSIQKFFKMRELNLRGYNVPISSFNHILIDNEDKPYYFLLHPDMHISNFFVPEKAYQEVTIEYLTGMKRLLCD